jgi:hypothetical protein
MLSFSGETHSAEACNERRSVGHAAVRSPMPHNAADSINIFGKTEASGDKTGCLRLDQSAQKSV